MRRHRLLLVLALAGFGMVPAIAGPPPILQSQVKGLLVVELGDGSHAGAASQMNATAIPGKDAQSFEPRFNQEVGKMMTAATADVEKLMRVRHPDHLPLGNTIEFAFADKQTLKDGSYANRGMSDPLWDNVTHLKDLRDAVDPRTRAYLDTFLTTASFIKSNRERKFFPPNLIRDLDRHLNQIKVEETKLLNSRDVREEMMED